MNKTLKFIRQIVLGLVFVGLMATQCEEDFPELEVTIAVNGNVLFDDGDDFYGDVDGDFTGTGGSGTRTFVWQNNLTTADYNADITAIAEGTFRMVVKDADGVTVLDKTLLGDREPDSIDGITASGTSGIWSVNIVLNNFNGDGSFSLSEGD